MFNGACPRSFPCPFSDSLGRRFGALLSFYTLTCQKASFYDLQLFISGLALNLIRKIYFMADFLSYSCLTLWNAWAS